MSISQNRNMRTRNNDGRIRKLRDDMLIRTLEEEYGIITGFSPDLTVEDLLNQLGFVSISQYLNWYYANRR